MDTSPEVREFLRIERSCCEIDDTHRDLRLRVTRPDGALASLTILTVEGRA